MLLYEQFSDIASRQLLSSCIIDTQILSYQDIMQKIDNLSKLLYMDNNNDKNYLTAICIDKSHEYIVAQLASNKNNKCFLPLDPIQLNRNKKIINTSQPKWFILNNTKQYNDYAKEIELTWLGAYNEHINLWVNNDIKSCIEYPLLCHYVIYSSGSTGIPKGIMLNDKGLVNVVKQQAKAFNIEVNTSFAWLLNPAFDASLSDIYTTLLSGGILYIPNFGMNKIKKLCNYFIEHKITHSDLSPSILPFLTKVGLPPTLKVIVFGGEIASEIMVKEISKKYDIQLFNAYGPTETTVCSSFSKVNDSWTSTNIGKPLKNVLYKIVNNELHIGGQHLALGYTEESLNTKFYIEDGIRWYKTGDQAKEKEGVYFYQGRLDNQFKYHGQLICSEEIENAAYQQGIENSACVYDEKRQKIHLYYVGTEDENIVKEKLGLYLTSYMIPHFFHKMDELPKNSNGKIDLRILKDALI